MAIQRSVLLVFVALFAAALPAQESYAPLIHEASNEGEVALSRFRVPDGFAAELFAAEPLLANPVAFHVDPRGRFYVVETFRLSAGVTDTRRHMYWRDDDLACRTVADRVALYKKHLGDKLPGYSVEHDRLRLVVDDDGDGKADRSTVFVDGFNNLADGLAAGVLARGDDVWFACIPDLWLLRDEDGDGRADVKKSLSTGYGVHVGYLGHDLHGLRLGPDGRLYFSIGDRGLNVTTAEGRRLEYPHTGTVLRCNPDGSELEVFAFGLRNPQELAFDEYGNLFTGDNNSDGGDKARWVHVVEGGDTGWRMGYQYKRSPVLRGPWNEEKLWHTQWKGQAAHILPPLAHLADGPSGLTYYPGSGLPDRYRGHFFLCDFRGDSSVSGIRTFRVRPRGASFEVVDESQFIWSILATDVDFAADGALYVTDWVDGWEKPNKGRIYRFYDTESRAKAEVQEVARLLGEGLRRRSVRDLEGLLAHADMRVRQEAQFELVRRQADGAAVFGRVAVHSENLLARLHSIWGIEQLGRSYREVLDILVPLLTDRAPEVRAQAAKAVGDARLQASLHALIGALVDRSPRVQLFAAMALGKFGRAEAIAPLCEMLRNNNDVDPYLRHAGVMGLVGIGDLKRLLEHASDPSPAVRMGILLALRRLRSSELRRFLNDSDPFLVAEAARAINDVPMDALTGDLAAVLGSAPVDRFQAGRTLAAPALVRAINANFRLGRKAGAEALARFAARDDASDRLRLEALSALSDWPQPPRRDRVTGSSRPLGARSAAPAVAALRAFREPLLAASSPPVRQRAIELLGASGVQEAAPALREVVADGSAGGHLRGVALQALGDLGVDDLREIVARAAGDADPLLRIASHRQLARLDPVRAVAVLKTALESGEREEKQSAFVILGDLDGPGAEAVLTSWLGKLSRGEVSPAVQLDLLEAAAKRTESEVSAALNGFEESRAQASPVERHREALVGGDPERGEEIFSGKSEVACMRCHRAGDRGGSVGPDLKGIGTRQTPEYLLESLVEPARAIAKGFESVIIVKNDGNVVAGLLRDDNERALVVRMQDATHVVVLKIEIASYTPDKVSAMPEDVLKHLSGRELRDLVAFLVSLKEATGTAHER
jgi:quinoprotein glucose dehydrogenase